MTRFSRNLYLMIHGTLPPRRLAHKARRGPARDTRYLAWIRTLRCAACGRGGPNEAAHVGRAAMSQKCADYETIPLCHQCHRTGIYSYHGAGKLTFAAMYCLDYSALVAKYNALWAKVQDVVSVRGRE